MAAAAHRLQRIGGARLGGLEHDHRAALVGEAVEDLRRELRPDRPQRVELARRAGRVSHQLEEDLSARRGVHAQAALTRARAKGGAAGRDALQVAAVAHRQRAHGLGGGQPLGWHVLGALKMDDVARHRLVAQVDDNLVRVCRAGMETTVNGFSRRSN
eukprot:1835114-Prymnesium_polylepis.2